MKDVAIIGGGVSGLATAHALAAQGRDVVVLERQARIGGNARSLRLGGFLMELGPTTMNAALPGMQERLVALGLADTQPLGANVRKRYLADRGRLHGISVNPSGFLLSNYLSFSARLRLMAELVIPRHKDNRDESVHAFASRRFGRAFADRVMDPMVAGIFMGDSHEISVKGAFPRLAAMEARKGSVIRAVLAAKRGAEPGRRLFSWREGIGTLPGRLAADMEAKVQTGVAVTGVARAPGGFAISTRAGTLRARAVVLAVQPHVAAMLLEQLDPEAASAAAAIPAPPVAVAFFGYARRQVAHPLDGLGYLTTRGSGILSGVQFPSTMFAHRAPEGHVAIAAYLGGARRADLAVLPESELQPQIEAELRAVLGISGGPVLARLHHWPIGLPHYTLGHAGRRAVLEEAPARVPGLYLTGNYLSGVSVANCLENGTALAARMAQDLDRTAPTGRVLRPATVQQGAL